MNINRNNYEEFFLLYVDNELSAAERNAVELFVRENTDLKEELHLLQQTVIKMDGVVFENKSSLLKEDITALQENLLLYIDNELNPSAKQGIEKLLQTDAVANKELSLLQQTKLQADSSIIFTNKNVLYRKESAKVIGMPWKRIAAAAVLLGFGAWVALAVIKTGNKAGDATGVANNSSKTVTPVQQANEATIIAQDKNLPADTNTGIAQTTEVIESTNQKNALPVAEKQQQQNTHLQKEEQNIIAVQQEREIKKPSNNLPAPVYKNINNYESNLTARLDVTQKKTVIDNDKSGIKDIITASNQTSDAIEGYALNTKFTEGDEVQEEDHKKSKLGGFFRKVKRMVERNTNVQSGNGVKIAGFDIAIK